MHLKQLKLAGFKSFVDPTTVPFPSQLVAVVGPNGCGKSNIIDAVRWVMGESSAKNLRGESMVDVIFNGSSNRKAVGQASVELIFDNSLGRLAGPYASYQEIAVKRLVTRDGDSHYFLNGTRCRRRDITDIFLGTGAGARGYSIIGQGTISRLIEARPEELRAYLEEAAGVSKYKERRRETLTRINHTRENLARVADIREELDKQLQRLERQAKAAERYQILKSEESQTKAEIMCLKWQGLHDEQVKVQQIIKGHELTFEKHQANAAQIYQQSTTLRERLHEETEAFQDRQGHFYQLATEIARLEESLQQQQREKQNLQTIQQQVQQDWQLLSSQQQLDSDALQQSEVIYSQALDDLRILSVEMAEKEGLLQQNQQQQQAWQTQADLVAAGLNKAANDRQMAELHLKHSLQGYQETQTRLQTNHLEQQQLDTQALQHQLSCLKDQTLLLQNQFEEAEHFYQISQTQNKELAEALREIEKTIRSEQDKGYQLHKRQATLTALLQTALGRQNGSDALSHWQDKLRLAETLQVDEQWQSACEMVFNDELQAIVVDSLQDVFTSLQTVAGTQSMFVTAGINSTASQSLPRLSDKISGIKPCFPLDLDKILLAANLDEAISRLHQINSDESLITPDGYWLGQGWLKMANHQEQDEQGLLVRQQALLDLQQEVAQSEEQLSELLFQRDQCHQQLAEQEKSTLVSQKNLGAIRDALHLSQTDITACNRQLQQAISKHQLLAEERENLVARMESLAEKQLQAQDLLQKANAEYQHFDGLQQQLLESKAQWQSHLSADKLAVEQVRSLLHRAELQSEGERLKINQLKQALQRGLEQLQILQERLETITSQLLALENPDFSTQVTLQDKVMQHHELENLLTAHRELLQDLNNDMDRLTTQIKAEEKQARDVQVVMQQAQMDEQALKVRSDSLMESLSESGVRLVDLLKTMPVGATLSSHERLLLEIVNKISRLGAINLAAIEEYELESQRKNHLDAQYNDLHEALATLDAAIEKMDRETRQRFQTTFDEVNTAFQSLFPRLFGGGRAMLELTCDNLLEAGVLVMAQPPGKRNSTIHLLSGGEKAMTAVALVFAIFQLNPSPFCMLDEVDAPLDDVNVGRFCTLVKEMSQFVQFLFITHNKVTMELADHLIGVTMREPGVSRVVAVDVEQALSMTKS